VQVIVAVSTAKVRSLSASPNPIRLGSGQTFGTAALTWRATGVARVQVRVGSPSGTPMTGLEAPVGAALTGNWVVDGMTFYLQDASDGDSSGSAKTLASITLRVL
jgi:hypothetical protein